jgi:CheY-like chemotaxis protein
MPAHRHAVLVVENHDDFREALEVLVSSTGLDVVAVHSGADALDHLRHEARRWCLVLLDWWLADMTGEEFRQQQVADPRSADVCLAVVTGDARVKENARGLGIEYFLLKPVDPEIVLKLLAHHCTTDVGAATD